jgi:glucokinase
VVRQLVDRFEEVGRFALSALNLSSDLAGIAVAVPGPFDYSNGVSWLQHKFASWFGINVRRHLAIRFGVDEKDILFLNDADAFLFGELRDSFAPRAAGITLGTGVGDAFAIDAERFPQLRSFPTIAIFILSLGRAVQLKNLSPDAES